MSTTANPIAVRGVSAVAVEIHSDAYTRRSEIIETAKFCPPAVTDADTQAEVTNAVRDIRRLLKEVEDGRKAVKAPVFDIGRKIDSAAEEFCRDLIAEEKRLTGLLTSYQVEQQRIAREAEAKRQAELARQQEEERKRQAEIDRQAREAEQARLAAERAERDALDEKRLTIRDAFEAAGMQFEHLRAFLATRGLDLGADETDFIKLSQGVCDRLTRSSDSLRSFVAQAKKLAGGAR